MFHRSMKVISRNPCFRQHVIKRFGLFGRSNFLQAQWDSVHISCEEIRKEIESSSIDESLIAKLDKISNEICTVADACNFITSFHSCNDVANTAEEVYMQAISYVEALNTDEALYLKIKALKENSVWQLLDQDTKHATNMFIDEFEKSGTQLNGEKRNIFVETNNEIFKAGSIFVEAAHQPTSVSITKCPTPLLNLICGSSPLITLSEADLNSRYDDVREASWKLYHRFDKSREGKLCALLNQRQRLSSLSGFENHCEREIKGSTAKSPVVVQDFLNELNHQLKDSVDAEIDLFRKSKRTREPVGIWDISYYAVESRCKYMQKYAIFQSNLNLTMVMEALNKLSLDMFDVELVCEGIKTDEVWHADVLKYSVRTQCGQTLGIIYCDFYRRPGKDKQICLHTIQCGTLTQMPIVVLVCNFDKDGFIQTSDVNLLFHEYGHALHAVLGRTRYQHVSGTRCPTDFAEIPSILLDSMINQSSIMTELFNREDLKDKRLPSISMSDCYNATETQVQLYYAMLDQLLHSSNVKDTRKIASIAQKKYLSQFEIPSSTAWHQRFAHLYFYGGRYYSYLWAQAIVNIIIERHDLKNTVQYSPEIKALFEQGGSKDCSYQIESLLGESLSIDKMVASLVKPLSSFNTLIESA